MAKELKYEGFVSWIEDSQIIEIGRIIRKEEKWKVVDRKKIVGEKSKNFSDLVAKKIAYENDRHRCFYLPRFMAKAKKEKEELEIWFCFGCFDFQAMGNLGTTEIKSFAPIAEKLLVLFEEHYKK